MPAPLSIEAQALLKLLDDGEWHDLEFIKVKLAERIAPGKALRRYNERVANRQNREGPRKTELMPESEQIASGQRVLAGVAINSMKKKYVEVRDRPGGQEIRVRPDAPHRLNRSPAPPESAEDPAPAQTAASAHAPTPAPASGAGLARAPIVCETCGLWVVNRDQHDEWHELQGPPAQAPAPGVDADMLRTVIREEVNDILDDFGRGMADWLLERFAALEAVVAPPAAPPAQLPWRTVRREDRRGTRHRSW